MLAGQIVGSRRPVVVDLCCGSGAVGAALAAALDVELYAVDVDPEAVRCARRNVGPVGGVVYAGDLYAPLPADLHGRVEVLAANAPYVPTDDIRLLPLEARLHEPRAALDGAGRTRRAPPDRRRGATMARPAGTCWSRPASCRRRR